MEIINLVPIDSLSYFPVSIASAKYRRMLVRYHHLTGSCFKAL
jgi:hypothetical protein